MKRFIILFVTAIVVITSVPAYAAGNNVIFSADTESAVFRLEKQQLDRDHTDSTLKYYTFSVKGLTVRADKNNFYDHDLSSVEFTLKSLEFSVKFIYDDGSSKTLDTVPLEMRYTVTRGDITECSVPVFGQSTLTVSKVQSGSMEFMTTRVGAFSVKNYEFTDVKDPSMWYYKPVNGCAALGVLSGMGDGTFMPQNTVTRAELAVMIVRSTESVISYRIDEKIKFNDVEKGKWYYEPIMKCATMGIVFGKSTTEYAPNEPATREQIAAVIARVVNITGMYAGAPLPDVTNTGELAAIYKDHASISNYARSNVLLCNKLKIMIGDAQGFRPKSNTTRAECAVIFHSVKNSLIY